MHTLLVKIGVLDVTFVDLLDILMVAAIIYMVFRWIKGTAAMNIFIAIVSLLALRIVVDALNMKMMSSLMGTVIDVGTIALIIIFQPEIRHFLNRIGRRTFSSTDGRTLIDRILNRKAAAMSADAVDEVARACFDMAEQRTGALIVLPRTNALEDIISTGDRIDAAISRRLIENIFFKNSPLHDGAMVIGPDKIIAARCTLPITDRTDIPARYGMRHKAAIGMSENSDADVIVVSEQTGSVTFVSGGVLTSVSNTNTLKLLLTNDRQKTGSETGV